jgi:hypothetical protein
MPQGTRQHPRGPHPVRSTSIAGSVRGSTRCVSMALTVASLPRTSASSCLNSTCSNTPSTWHCCKPSSRAPARSEGGHFGQTGWGRWPFQRASRPGVCVNLLAAPAYYYRVIGSLVHRVQKNNLCRDVLPIAICHSASRKIEGQSRNAAAGQSSR